VIVSVDLGSAFIGLEDPADCSRFLVAATGAGGVARLGEVLQANAIGRTDGDDAFIEIDVVRRLAAGRVDDSWEADFAAMLDYARTKGWLDADNRAIRAHVEWSP
jgi:hypothetical protein